MDKDIQTKIREAAAARGLNPDIVLSIAGSESTLSNEAKNPRSSARGLFQVTDQSWKDAKGNPKLRGDVNENIRVGTDIIASNRDIFVKKFNREPSAKELYTMHFLGSKDASKVFAADPNQAMNALVPEKVIKANPFLKKMNVADFIAFAEKKGGGKQAVAEVAPAPKPKLQITPDVAPGTATFIGAQAPKENLRDSLPELGSNYQTALAAMTLADTKDDTEDDESEAEKYAAYRERLAAEQEAAQPQPAMAQLDITSLNPFEEEPVMMAKGGEVEEEGGSMPFPLDLSIDDIPDMPKNATPEQQAEFLKQLEEMDASAYWKRRGANSADELNYSASRKMLNDFKDDMPLRTEDDIEEKKKKRYYAQGGEVTDVQRLAYGGLPYVPTALISNADKQYVRDAKSQYDLYQQQVDSYNKARDEWEKKYYNPYASELEKFNAEADKYNQQAENYLNSIFGRDDNTAILQSVGIASGMAPSGYYSLKNAQGAYPDELKDAQFTLDKNGVPVLKKVQTPEEYMKSYNASGGLYQKPTPITLDQAREKVEAMPEYRAQQWMNENKARFVAANPKKPKQGYYMIRVGDYNQMEAPGEFGRTAPTLGKEFSMDAPSAPSVNQAEVEARIAAAQKKQAKQQLVYDVMADPERYNLSMPAMFAEGGSAEKSTAADMLKTIKQAVVPAQLRTFLETALMEKEDRAGRPITEKDFSESELRQILDTIGSARKNRTAEKRYNDNYKPSAKEQKENEDLIMKAFGTSKNALNALKEKNQAEKEYFQSGKGSVNYMDYPGHLKGVRDSTLSKEGAVRNTLGRFTYETLPDGRIKVKDTYDFKDDLVKELGQRPSSAYKDLGTMGKLGTILVDTLNNPMDLQSEAGGIAVGRATLPSRMGSAFIGQNGRPVDITLDPRELMPGYAGYAHGGVVHRANGSPVYGEMADTGPITADTRAAMSNFQVPNAREAMAALKKIYGEGVSNAESLLRGSAAAIPGMVGDIGQAFNIRGMRDAPTTEQLLEKYPQRMTTPTAEGKTMQDIGTYMPLPVPPAAISGTAKAMMKGLKESGPQIESTLSRKFPAFAPMNITPESAKAFEYMGVPESSMFTSAVDSFVASQKNPVTKQQLLGQMKGKFRDYEIGRVSEALADLPDTARILPDELAARVSQAYPTNKISTYTLEPSNSDRWASMDNPYFDFPVGVVNMRFNTPIENVKKAIVSEDALEVLTNLSGSLWSLPKEADIKMLSNYVSSLPNAKEYSGLSKQLDTIGKTATSLEKKLVALKDVVQPYKYPALTDNWSDLISDYFKQNKGTTFEEAQREVNLKLQLKADDSLKKMGIEVPSLNLSLEERLAKIEEQVQVKRNKLIEDAKDVLSGINDKVRPEMVNLANELKKETVYKGQHPSLTPKRSPIGFSRFVDQTSNIPGIGETKVMHMIELQSDLYDDIIKQGTKSGSKAKDIEEIEKLKPKITELLANPKVKDAAGKINHIRTNYPSTANVEKSEEISKIVQGNPEIKKELIEYLKLSDKQGKLSARSKYSGKYDIDEPFYGIEKSPQVVQQMMIKNAIGAAMKRGVNAVTFPGKESKQAQLYEKLEPNLKQVIKDLGAGFEIRPMEMYDSLGNMYTHTGVVWNPDTAKRVISEGIRFNKGGSVDKQNLDYRRYI